MWANIDIRSKSDTEVIVGALAEENRKKMEGLVGRFGTILALSKEEERVIGVDMEMSVQNIINTHLK
jgi:asparagine synthetase B (glutamine-hydrolysing)